MLKAPLKGFTADLFESVGESHAEILNMEELQAKHRQEQRSLQARIAQKRKSATKKTRKGINDECETLQRDLDERQRGELAALDGNPVEERSETLQIQNHTEESDLTGSTRPSRLRPAGNDDDSESANEPVQLAGGRTKKPNRQKARLARRAAENEAQIVQAEAEAANMPNQREQEREAMRKLFQKLSLRELEIRPDGHCMYSAVASQLNGVGLTPQILTPGSLDETKPKEGFRAVRNSAAAFIETHADDFAPFLEVPIGEYVHQIRSSAEWGGQLELQAISKAYNINLNVVQADGSIEKIESGQGSETKQIWLAYYRHSFGLGEHYNALTRDS